MSLKEIVDDVKKSQGLEINFQQLREEIISEHAKATTVEERVSLLSLHTKLMDQIENKLTDNVDREKFKRARLQEYNMLLTRECVIDGSVCVETLYELTHRELESGRMKPNHSFITLAEDAMSQPHYSRSQLLRQEEKFKKSKEKSNLSAKLLKMIKD